MALLQLSEEVPEPLGTLRGVRVHERFVEFVVDERLTVPAKPFTEAMVIVEAPPMLRLTGTVVGLADTVKSWTM
jgi:hypothetical protein